MEGGLRSFLIQWGLLLDGGGRDRGTTFTVDCCELLQSHQSLQAGLHSEGLVKVTDRAWLSNRGQSGSRCAVKGSQGSRHHWWARLMLPEQGLPKKILQGFAG